MYIHFFLTKGFHADTFKYTHNREDTNASISLHTYKHTHAHRQTHASMSLLQFRTGYVTISAPVVCAAQETLLIMSQHNS